MKKEEESIIKLAVVTQYGMETGGTEKFLQTIASFLPKDRYNVDYYYIASDSKRVSKVKEKQLLTNGVNLKPYSCDAINCKFKYLYQKNSNFFDIYKNDYDLILTGSSGIAEEPLTFIRNIPILQSIHYVDGADNQFNISRVLNISKFSEKLWVSKGGDKKRSILVSHPIYIPSFNQINIRKKFNISEDTFIYGFHQRNDDRIFSDIPLKAFKKINNEKVAFIICGGSKLYKKEAQDLNLKNCFFIPETDNNDIIYSFLNTINVYAHGRADGELNSTALAEAMYFGLPIITHPSNKFNGHLEVVTNNGMVADNVDEYAKDMKKMLYDKQSYEEYSLASKEMFKKKYDLNNQIFNFMSICESTLKNPYPNKLERSIRGFFAEIKHIVQRNLIKFVNGK